MNKKEASSQSDIRQRFMDLIPRLGMTKRDIAKTLEISRVTLDSFLDGNDVDLKRIGKITAFIEQKEAQLSTPKRVPGQKHIQDRES